MGCGSSNNFKNTSYDIEVIPIFKRNIKYPSSLHFVKDNKPKIVKPVRWYDILEKKSQNVENHMNGIYHSDKNIIEIEFDNKKYIYTQGRNHKHIWVYSHKH